MIKVHLCSVHPFPPTFTCEVTLWIQFPESTSCNNRLLLRQLPTLTTQPLYPQRETNPKNPASETLWISEDMVNTYTAPKV